VARRHLGAWAALLRAKHDSASARQAELVALLARFDAGSSAEGISGGGDASDASS